MSLSDDFGNAFTEMAAAMSGAASTVTYTHDGGTVTAIPALFEVIEERTEDANAKGSPNVGALRRYYLRSSYLSAVTRHIGSDIITDGGIEWRTINMVDEAGAGNLVFTCELDLSYSEA